MASAEQLQKDMWELSLYEMQRTAQPPITDNTEIAVSPRSMHNEFMCPICLDVLKKTMTTKECLHRFCSDCIVTALRSGNKECPTCRKKLVSKRSLRPDPNFDLLIAKIFPSRDVYEAQQETMMARLNRAHSSSAFASSVSEGIRMQSQSRFKRLRRNAPSVARASPEPSTSARSTTPSPVPSTSSSNSRRGASANQTSQSANTSGHSEEMDSSEMEVRTNSVEMQPARLSNDVENEVEMIFKPHPTGMSLDDEIMDMMGENPTRYAKTTDNATVAHLARYMLMRLLMNCDQTLPCYYLHHRFFFYVWPQTSSFGTWNMMRMNAEIEIEPTSRFLVKLADHVTLSQIILTYWRIDRPLVLYYTWRSGVENHED